MASNEQGYCYFGSYLYKYKLKIIMYTAPVHSAKRLSAVVVFLLAEIKQKSYAKNVK